MLNGEIGDYVTIARRERGGDDCYPGSPTDELARSLDAALSFLDDGRGYTAQVYRDDDDADHRDNREDIVIDQREVTRADTLNLRPAPGGGQAIRVVAH